MEDRAPILEFDPDRDAVVNPSRNSAQPLAPRTAVACFLPRLVQQIGESGRALGTLPSLLPLFEIDYAGSPLAVYYPGQGAPLCAVTTERVLASGVDAALALAE